MGEIVPAHPEDVDLAPDLAEIVQTWRGVYADKMPLAQDVRYTLRALCLDADPLRALESLDPISEGMVRAALIKQTESEIILSPDDRVRDAARVALKKFTRSIGGRPSRAQTDEAFARVLVAYWIRTNGNKPTVTVESYPLSQESKFLSWAWDIFLRSGRKLSSSNLAPILRRANREVSKRQAI